MPKTEPRRRERNLGEANNESFPSWDGGRDSVRQAELFLQQETKRRHELTARLVTRQDERNLRHVTPWLLLRYFEDPLGIVKDLSYRPIPSAQPFWNSPDITIETSGLLDRRRFTAGQVNYVHAKIRNLGAFTAAPVKGGFLLGRSVAGFECGAHAVNIKEPGDRLGGSVYLEIESQHTADVRYPRLDSILGKRRARMPNCKLQQLGGGPNPPPFSAGAGSPRRTTQPAGNRCGAWRGHSFLA